MMERLSLPEGHTTVLARDYESECSASSSSENYEDLVDRFAQDDLTFPRGPNRAKSSKPKPVAETPICHCDVAKWCLLHPLNVNVPPPPPVKEGEPMLCGICGVALNGTAFGRRHPLEHHHHDLNQKFVFCW